MIEKGTYQLFDFNNRKKAFLTGPNCYKNRYSSTGRNIIFEGEMSYGIPNGNIKIRENKIPFFDGNIQYYNLNTENYVDVVEINKSIGPVDDLYFDKRFEEEPLNLFGSFSLLLLLFLFVILILFEY